MCENKIISEIFTFKYSSNIFTNCVLVLSCFNRCFLATIPSWSLHRWANHRKLITIARSTSQKLAHFCGSTVSICEHTRVFTSESLLWTLVNTQGFSHLWLYYEDLWTHKNFRGWGSTVRTCEHTRVFPSVALLWELVDTQVFSCLWLYCEHLWTQKKTKECLLLSIILLMKTCLKVTNFMAVK